MTLILDARTNYKMDAAAGWRSTDPEPRITAAIAAAGRRSYKELRDEHQGELSALMQRVSVDWGTTPDPVAKVPTDLRLAAYGAGQDDPSLEQTLFAYGRYLLLGSSRQGGLPANLQGVWNESNTPPWASDYHTNINVQMNYWGAETTNLSESHLPLVEYVKQVAVPSRVATRNAFGAETRGWTARTSQSIFGGNSWEWNVVSSAWYAQHIYEHWAFSQDVAYLRGTALPMLKEICNFWEDRLKEDANGKLVSPKGWSPEHGPTEDGVMYDQQIIWDLFQNYTDCEDAALELEDPRPTPPTGTRSRTCSPALPRTRSASGASCRNGRRTVTTPTTSTATPRTCSPSSRAARSTSRKTPSWRPQHWFPQGPLWRARRRAIHRRFRLRRQPPLLDLAVARWPVRPPGRRRACPVHAPRPAALQHHAQHVHHPYAVPD